MPKHRVYVAGALNAKDALGYLVNVSKMMETANKLMDAGFAVFVPALDLLMCIKFGNYSYEKVFENSQPFLDVCEAIFLVEGWQNSPGTNRELDRASKNDTPAFEDISVIVKYFERIDNKLNTEQK